MRTHRVFLQEIIDERKNLYPLAPRELDELLAKGWRLLGFGIVRHNYGINNDELCLTIPLRIRISDPLMLSRSQRKLLRRNKHLKVRVEPIIQITEEKEKLFFKHTKRFRSSVPTSIFSFLCPDPKIPAPGVELCVYEGDQLIACSYMHLGKKAVSATYCFFDPDFSHYRLGIYTMLLEMDLCHKMNKKFYYHGYCYDEPSQFDYKLGFYGLEYMNWKTECWHPLPRITERRIGDIDMGMDIDLETT